METSYSYGHYCCACNERWITLRFAICSECEKRYGNSAIEWPDWLRFAWNDEQRSRRRENKAEQTTLWFDVGFAEDVFEYVCDGFDFFISNRNERRYENYDLMEEALNTLKDDEHTALVMRFQGYPYNEIGYRIDKTRTTAKNYIDRALEKMNHYLQEAR